MGQTIKVASLFAGLGLKVDKAAWANGTAAIERLKSGLATIAKVGAVAGVALGGLGVLGVGAGLKFNATMEETRNQIAGMLSLAKKTDLADQLGTSDALMKSLQERAKKLPGSLTDYTKVLGMVAQPLVDAGLSIKDLEDLTVGAAVAAKAMSVDLEAAARDVNQAVMGQFHSTDQLTGRLLGSLGYVGEAGREKFNKLSKARRAQVLKEALTQKQLAQMADAQSKSANGRMDTFKATVVETLGRVAAPLFAKLTNLLGGVNVWLEANSAAVDKFASAVGGVLAKAFEFAGVVIAKVSDAIKWLTSGSDEALAVIVAMLISVASVIVTMVVPALIAMAAGWVAALAPVLLTIAAIALVAYGVIKLVRHWDTVKRAGGRAWDWIKDKAHGFVRWLAGIGVMIAAPFIAAFEMVRSVVMGLIDGIVAKIDWVVNKAKSIGSAVTGSIDIDAMKRNMMATQGGVTAPTLSGAANGGATTNNNVNATATINISGAGDPKMVAAEVARQQRTMWDAQMRLNEDM